MKVIVKFVIEKI